MIMKRKAIIFDMGGVLVDLDMDGCKRAFIENLGFDEINIILDPVFIFVLACIHLSICNLINTYNIHVHMFFSESAA